MHATLEADPVGDAAAARANGLLAIVPAYLGLFVWLAFFDEVWVFAAREAEPRLVEWVFDVLVATVSAAGLLFLGPALWGFQTGLSERSLAETTFGTRGARWLLGRGLAIAHLAIYALAIGFAVETTLLGFTACGLIEPENLGVINLGPIQTRSPVFLTTAAFWILITSKAEGLGLAGVIAALMRVYAPVALLVISAAGLWIAAGGIPEAALDHEPVAASVRGTFAWSTHGFFAVAAIAAPTWGASLKRRRDVVLGTVLGVALPAAWIGIVSLFAVLASLRETYLTKPGPTPVVGSFRFAILEYLSPVVAAVALVALGLAAVAPAYFACHEFTRRLWDHGTPRKRVVLIRLGAVGAFLLVAPRPLLSIGDVSGILGDLVAPLIGAMLATAALSRGDPPGAAPGVRPGGVLAWILGTLVGISLDALAWFHPWLVISPFPPAFYGFLAALLARLIAEWTSRLGKDRAIVHN